MERAERHGTYIRNGLPNTEARRPRRAPAMNSNEDLFLNLAKDEPSKPINPRIKDPSTRRSTSRQLEVPGAPFPATVESSQYQQYLRRPSSSSSAVPETLRDTFSDHASISSDDHNAHATTLNTTSRPFPPSAANLDSRARRHNSIGDSSGPTKPQYRSALRQSNLAYVTPAPNDSAYTSHTLKFLDQTPATHSPTDGAESVGSTTAASTVWDELEELRLRIRRLEHSGNRARSGGIGADDSADRPHTATTMTTTSSASRPLKQLMSSPTMTASTHPLLESALAKAKDVVDPDIFRSLESSVSDATAVAELAANGEYSQTLNGSNNTLTASAISQKKLRSKTESLVRSLTELCIALCEDAPRQSHRKFSRPASRDSPFQAHMGDEESPLTYLDERRARLDRTRSTPHRPASIISESVAGSTRANNSASAMRQSLLSRYDRRRGSFVEEEENGGIAPRSLSRAATHISQGDGEDHDPTIRAPSRAKSEAHHPRRSPSRDLQSFSRNYTARHPLPERPLLPPRQTFGATNQSNVSLASTQISRVASRPYQRPESRSSSRLDGPLGPSPSLAERLAQRRQQQQQQQQVASAGQLGSISNASNSVPSRAFSGSGWPRSSNRSLPYESEQAAMDSDY